MIFVRKKTEKPKTMLGLALYEYDNLLLKDLRSLTAAIEKNKMPSAKKMPLMVSMSLSKTNRLLEDISRDNFKTDYRSDKIRECIISMISGLSQFLEDLEKTGEITDDSTFENFREKITKLEEERKLIKKKMKDIESDYL